MPRSAIPAVLLLGVLALSACGAQAQAEAPPASPTEATPATLTVEGSVTVDGAVAFEAATNVCDTDGGYDDIAYGTQVVVTDAEGATIALGKLFAGTTTYVSEHSYPGREVPCTFKFRVSDVPAGQSFYGVEVSHRGVLQYSAADLAEPIALSLG